MAHKISSKSKKKQQPKKKKKKKLKGKPKSIIYFLSSIWTKERLWQNDPNPMGLREIRYKWAALTKYSTWQRLIEFNSADPILGIFWETSLIQILNESAFHIICNYA